MKIVYNEKLNKLDFELEPSDKARYYRIKQLLDMAGWNDLKDIHNVARVEIINSIKKCARSKLRRDMCQHRAAMLDGLDQWIESVANFMAQIEVGMEKEKEGNNDGSFNDEE